MYFLCLERGDDMAISTGIQNEIKRKANAGIALTNPTADKQKLYDQYQQQTKNLVQQKAQSGQQLSAPNAWKNSLYQQYQNSTQNNQNQQIQQTMNTNKNTVQQKPKPYAFNTYNPTANVNEQYINKARNYNISAGKGEPYQGFVGNQYQAGNLLDNNQLRELAYYLQLQDNAINRSGDLYRNYMNQEINKGYGLSNDWAKDNTDLQEAMKQRWAIEDFIADKYGVNHQSDLTLSGLSRKDLGFNESGDFSTLEERWANSLQDDPWGVNSDYFNDPRHKGQQFAYMNYFDPLAYENQRTQAEDGRGIEYFYNTNFARENGYVDDNWDYNTNNFSDWRNLQHDDFVNKYGVGGTDWGGTQENLNAYNSMVMEILNKDGRIQQLMNQREQALNQQSPQVQKLREIMAANGLYNRG